MRRIATRCRRIEEAIELDILPDEVLDGAATALEDVNNVVDTVMDAARESADAIEDAEKANEEGDQS